MTRDRRRKKKKRLITRASVCDEASFTNKILVVCI